MHHQLKLRLISISFCMQRFGTSLSMAIASAKPNSVLLFARYRILKAFRESAVCWVSSECFVIALFCTPVLFCWSHLRICSASWVHKVLVVRPMYLHPQVQQKGKHMRRWRNKGPCLFVVRWVVHWSFQRTLSWRYYMFNWLLNPVSVWLTL